MAASRSLGPVHHLRLTVTDVQRFRVFSTELLGFQIAMDAPPPADNPHCELATELLRADDHGRPHLRQRLHTRADRPGANVPQLLPGDRTGGGPALASRLDGEPAAAAVSDGDGPG